MGETNAWWIGGWKQRTCSTGPSEVFRCLFNTANIWSFSTLKWRALLTRRLRSCKGNNWIRKLTFLKTYQVLLFVFCLPAIKLSMLKESRGARGEQGPHKQKFEQGYAHGTVKDEPPPATFQNALSPLGARSSIRLSNLQRKTRSFLTKVFVRAMAWPNH